VSEVEVLLDPAVGLGLEALVGVAALERQAASRCRPGNGLRRRHCCVVARPLELAGCRGSGQEQGRAAGDSASRKKTFARCWDFSRNWGNREKIRNTAWTCRRSNRG
jgi:hypothetical protein